MDIATVRANKAGSPHAAMEMDTARGTRSTVAPTCDITREKTVARIVMSFYNPKLANRRGCEESAAQFRRMSVNK